MKSLLAICSVLLLIACDEQSAQPQKLERNSIIRNLPVEDRDYLLEPLESALDDLRSVIDRDDALFSSNIMIDRAERVGEIRFKLNGKDTVFIDKSWKTNQLSRRRIKYWDKDGHLFYTEVHMTYLEEDGTPIDQRAYRMYLEEDLVPISTYGKASFNGHNLPDIWQTICPTKQELGLIIDTTGAI